jgi:hypothetical protein
VPPWEELHELSREELRLTNLVTTDAVADVLPEMLPKPNAPAVAELTTPKPVQDRFVSSAMQAEAQPQEVAPQQKSTKTAEAVVPINGVVAAPAK